MSYKKPNCLLKDVQQKRLTKKSTFLKKLEAEQAKNAWPKMTIEQLKARQAALKVMAVGAAAMSHEQRRIMWQSRPHNQIPHDPVVRFMDGPFISPAEATKLYIQQFGRAKRPVKS